jgi:hypothetical protein
VESAKLLICLVGDAAFDAGTVRRTNLLSKKGDQDENKAPSIEAEVESCKGNKSQTQENE